MTFLFFDIETVPEYAIVEDYKSAYIEYAQTEKDYLLAKETKDQHKIDEIKRSCGKGFWKFTMGGLDPIRGKIIAIHYQIDNQPKKFLLSGEDKTEKDILLAFYSVLTNLKFPSSLVGFNISKFDIPFIMWRLKNLNVDSDEYLYQRVYGKLQIDLMQIHLPLTEFDLSGLDHNALAQAYGFERKNEKGHRMRDWFYNKKYDEIRSYTDQEFVYHKIFEKIISEGLVSQEIIKKYLHR